MTRTRPLPIGSAVRALAGCAASCVALLARRRIHLPRARVGQRLHFADGTTGVVYRETVLDRPPPVEPTILVVEFRLRFVRGDRAHAFFRAESLLNTPLFVGFPGFCSKLWLAHDAHGAYRGFYQWDGPTLAEDYARALWWVLALVSWRDSIHYQVVPGLDRDDVLRDPRLLERSAQVITRDWWRLIEVDVSPA